MCNLCQNAHLTKQNDSHDCDCDFFFDVNKQIIFERKCSISTFLSKNVAPGKVVGNLSGSLCMKMKKIPSLEQKPE